MAAFKHGVYSQELGTKVIPPVRVDASLPFVVGKAALHNATEPAEAYTPYLIHTYEEAMKLFGKDTDKNGLHDFFYAYFVLYGLSPVVAVTVSDVKKTKPQTDQPVIFEGNPAKARILDQVLLKGFTLKKDETPLTENQDYVIYYDDDGSFVVELTGEASGTYKATYSILDNSSVDAAAYVKAIGCVEEVFPRFGLVPGLLLTSDFISDDDLPTVAAALDTKARSINGLFQAMALVDFNPEEFSKALEWKKKGNVFSPYQVACVGATNLGNRQFPLSAQIAGAIGVADKKAEDIPFWSPSNTPVKVSSLVFNNKEFFPTLEQANYLNSQGMVTALNWVGGWRAWGNRTAAYPANTDPKDCFIPVRRMFNWVSNTLILTFWQKVDNPMNRRLVETVIDSANIWLNSLVARGALIGANVRFIAEENPVTDLMDGIIRFHVSITPPAPAEAIHFVMEYDTKALEAFANQLGGDA